MSRTLSFLTVFVLFCISALQGAFAQDEYRHRFDTAWQLIDERYWNLDVIPGDWDEIGERYARQLSDITDEDGYWSLMEAMYEEIADDHSVFVRPERVEEIRNLYGDMPCLAVLGQVEPGLQLGTIHYGLVDLEPGSAGFIRIPDLASDFVTPNVRSAVRELLDAGAEGFVLDLRGNPGGRLVTMMQVAGVFTGGFLWRLVTTWSLPLPYPAIGPAETDLPLAILIDSNVHSAGEGLAGALRQVGRATTIGEATAGNVEAVLPFCLRDGSQAWVATGVLAPIGAATWQNVGVEPDIETSPDEAEAAAFKWLRSQLGN